MSSYILKIPKENIFEELKEMYPIYYILNNGVVIMSNISMLTISLYVFTLMLNSMTVVFCYNISFVWNCLQTITMHVVLKKHF